MMQIVIRNLFVFAYSIFLFSCKTLQKDTNQIISTKKPLKVFQLSNQKFKPCDSLPEFSYTSDSTEIYYKVIIPLNHSIKILDWIRDSLANNSEYKIRNFYSKDSLKVEYSGFYYLNPSINKRYLSCDLYFKVLNNTLIITAKKIKQFFFTGTVLIDKQGNASNGLGLESLIANLYSQSQIEQNHLAINCENIVCIDQKVKNILLFFKQLIERTEG